MSKSKSWIDEQGSKIAVNCEWDGTLILQVLSAALEDANFYHEAEIIDQMRAAYDIGETLPRFTLTWEPADEDARFIPSDAGDYGLFSDIDDDDIDDDDRDDDDRDDDEDDDGDGDDYTFPDDHPLFGLDDPAKLPEDDPNYIPF